MESHPTDDYVALRRLVKEYDELIRVYAARDGDYYRGVAHGIEILLIDLCQAINEERVKWHGF